MQNYGSFTIPANENYEPRAPRSNLARNLLKLTAITGLLAGGVFFCAKLDKDIDQFSASEYAEHLHNAQFLIPQFEKESNYLDAERLENEGWSYISKAKKGEYRATREQINILTNLLNNNNTRGAKAGEPLN